MKVSDIISKIEVLRPKGCISDTLEGFEKRFEDRRQPTAAKTPAPRLEELPTPSLNELMDKVKLHGEE